MTTATSTSRSKGGRTKKAQKYTKDFCEAVLKGLKKTMKEEVFETGNFMDEDGEEEEELEDALERELRIPEEKPGGAREEEVTAAYEPTEEDK